MPKRLLSLLILSLFLILTACTTETPPEPSQPGEQPTATSPAEEIKPTELPMSDGEPAVLVSEVLTGMSGNNNFEFIELTNTSHEAPVDLKGWALWYQLADGQDELLVHRWSEHTLIPPQGHYLLGRAGEDLGLTPDKTFEITMIPQKGGLQLRATDGTPLDSLAWGAGPVNFAEGGIAPAMGNGVALERAPGGQSGNFVDTADNAADFILNQSPNPQNTGSPLTPLPEHQLVVSIGAPETAKPGNDFAYLLSVSNQTGQTVEGLTVQMLIPLALEVQSVPDEIEVSDQATFWELPQIAQTHQVALWKIGTLDDGESASTSLTVKAPWTVDIFTTASYSAQAENWAMPAFGAPVSVSVEGGVVPIGNLIDLVGAQLTIEGTATMPTGALYAGTGNVKFYLEDETGGVQVWVPEGEGAVGVGIGARVRVQGKLEVYRGALELVTGSPADVEILVPAKDGQPWPAAPVDVATSLSDLALPGRLVQVEGLVTRNDEFSYSYEIDIVDGTGETLTMYVDKQTNINVEAIEPGQSYRAVGILEIYNTERELYPRVQADLERIYPPVLLLEIGAPITVRSGEVFEVTLTATNYTPETLTNVAITGTMPLQGAAFDSVSEGGEVNGSQISWTIPEIPGNGESASVSYWITPTRSEGYLTLQEYAATAEEWPDPAKGDPYYVFVGDTVPIWAIQGPGFRSPYILQPVTTKGIVTGLFPDLGGFWIQETSTDTDPLTSSGLFIATGSTEPSVVPGDEVQISGIVRETSQQTQIAVTALEDIVLLSEGNPLPAAVELGPPADLDQAIRYYEAIEGMFTQISGPARVVAPITKYGEYVLVRPDTGVERLFQGQDEMNGLAMMVDDGSDIVHTDATTYPYVVNAGDTVSGVVGPLAYTFGQYKIEPVTVPQVNSQTTVLPSLTPTGSDEFSIMTWNVENLFDTSTPHPADPPMLKPSEYHLRIEKVANTIKAAGVPLIIGLQEVENIGVLEDIAALEILADYGYEPLLIEGTDSRGIDVGYLIRGDRATFIDLQQFNAPEGLTSRPPLLVQVEVETANGPATVFVINNHFTSMSGGEEATEPRRNAQAAWNVEVLQQVLLEYPEAYVAVIGDLNSYYDSRPIDTLRESGLNHVFEVLSEEERYSYIYQGLSQTLDHILVTPALFELLRRVQVLHVNADYALPLPDDASPLHTSDHDPVVATFEVR